MGIESNKDVTIVKTIKDDGNALREKKKTGSKETKGEEKRLAERG